jgi:hypothetical protein
MTSGSRSILATFSLLIAMVVGNVSCQEQRTESARERMEQNLGLPDRERAANDQPAADSAVDCRLKENFDLPECREAENAPGN